LIFLFMFLLFSDTSYLIVHKKFTILYMYIYVAWITVLSIKMEQLQEQYLQWNIMWNIYLYYMFALHNSKIHVTIKYTCLIKYYYLSPHGYPINLSSTPYLLDYLLFSVFTVCTTSISIRAMRGQQTVWNYNLSYLNYMQIILKYKLFRLKLSIIIKYYLKSRTWNYFSLWTTYIFLYCKN